jgi:hypothetical protein
VVLAQHSPAGGQDLVVQVARALRVAEGLAGRGEIAHRRKGVGVIVAQHSPIARERLFE